MHSPSCLFCKIINKQLPSSLVLETENTIVIKDIHPKAPIHYLLIPKIHLEHMGSIEAQHSSMLVDLGLCVATLSKMEPEKGFNIVSNNGKDAGQSVAHLHWHFLSGKNLYEGGFSL
jgi:histidine triad (HIT) family protein